MMTKHAVKKNVKPFGMSFFHQFSGLFQRAEAWINGKVVGSEIAGSIQSVIPMRLPFHWLGIKDRGHPNGIHTQ